MTRGRRSDDEEADAERLESALACLGNALVFVELVDERIRLARMNGYNRLLEPAAEDLRKIEQLIKKAQRGIA